MNHDWLVVSYPGMNKINSVMQSQIDLLLIGEEKDAKVVADEIVRKVNPLIKKGQWRA